MKLSYGNLIYDATLLGQIWKQRTTGGELAQRRELEIINKIHTDKLIHSNDVIPFTYNDINTVYQLATGYLNEWKKVFDFLLEVNLTYSKDKKLKMLAKLYDLSKRVGYKKLSIIISGTMVYCKNFENQLNEEEFKNVIFSYSLVEIVLNLLEGLTPREVYGLFPIDKEYDGYKLETKDYFSCMEEVKTIGLDKTMTQKDAEYFVMNCNTHKFIMHTGVGLMSLVSDFNNWDLDDIVNMFKGKPKLHIIK